MKRVLYIGYLKEQSDWGFFATQNILALEKAGYDVVCRSIDFSTVGRVDKKIQHLFNKDIGGEPYDVTFQHVFPNHMVASDNFGKCVAITTQPMKDVQHSTWWDGLNLMDEVFTLDELQYFDPDTYKQNYSGVSVGAMDDGFKFYTTASEKSLPAILRCFHTEFSPDEPVHLLVQVENKGEKKWHDLITRVKSEIGTMPLEKYKKDMVVDGYDTPISRYQLHSYCQCFLSENNNSLSRNDCEAALLGTSVISAYHVEECTPRVMVDLINWVPSVKVRKKRQEKPLFADRNNAMEFDLALDEKLLAEVMRAKFETWKDNPIQFGQLRQGIDAASRVADHSLNTFKSIIG